MAIKKVSNEFMAKVLNDVAWKALSNTSNKILFHEECMSILKIIGIGQNFQVILI